MEGCLGSSGGGFLDEVFGALEDCGWVSCGLDVLGSGGGME